MRTEMRLGMLLAMILIVLLAVVLGGRGHTNCGTVPPLANSGTDYRICR